MFTQKKDQGFTLIELLLVVVIIGILLAVIVPRAWRANIDAKYGLVRQNCTELVSFASQWAEQMMAAQNSDSASMLSAYFNSLNHFGTGNAGNTHTTVNSGQWIARAAVSNWNTTGSGRNIGGRSVGAGSDTIPEAAVQDIVPPERLPLNPFTGRSVFMDLPTTTAVIPGAIAAGRSVDGNFQYYGLVFQGTGSEPSALGSGAFIDAFHAGMGLDLAGLRNGIFMARLPIP